MWLVWSLTVAGDNAVASGLPSAVCADSICSPAQEEVWRGFQNSGGLDSPLPVPSVFSGVCYHHNPYLDPNQVHYGAVLIDDLDGRVSFDARFSFNQADNPYLQLDAAMAVRRFAMSSENTPELELFARYAYADFTGVTGGPFRYWLRQNTATERFYLVGYFGFLHTILCALDRHPA